MPIGLTHDVNKGTIDFMLGNVAQKLNLVMEEVDNFKFFIDTTVDADLITLGYTQDEVTLLRTCAADMDELQNIYTGAAALAAAKDFRTFLRRVWGTGYGTNA